MKYKLNNTYTEHVFGSSFSNERLPHDTLLQNSVEPRLAYELIDELLVAEGSSRLNLATFCQTYMEPEAVTLMTNSLSKNAIDKSEYPQVTALEQKCIQIIANLWHSPDSKLAVGTSTVGSSEACMLAGIAMKKRWQVYAAQNNLSPSKLPNLIISAANQVCWEKFSVYFDVELKIIPINNPQATLDIDAAIAAIDEYTIGLVGILGITYTGMYDDIFELDQKLSIYNQSHDYPLSIHVDAASGGMYAPFIQPELIWDFQLENVGSINTSGHKYGLVYPGIGWIIFKNKSYIPSEMIFYVNYLGGVVPSMSLNFSHSASNLVAQYYNFVRLGIHGYHSIHLKTQNVCKYLIEALQVYPNITVITADASLPLVSWYLNDQHQKKWNLYDLADQLQQSGWQVPTYPLACNMQEIIISRIVCRSDLSFELATVLVDDIISAIKFLNLKNSSFHTDENKIYGFMH